MNRKTVYIVLTCVLVSVQFCRASVQHKGDTALEIYLPREITIKNDSLKLGQVSIIQGRQALAAKAGEIALGRIAMPGQEITIDRSTVMSRLACNGIPASEVKLTGAEKITVKRQQQVVKGSDFVETASSFLRDNPIEATVRQWEPIQIPKDLIVAGTNKEIKLSPSLMNSARNHAKVKVTAIADGQQLGSRKVTFRLKYNCRRAIASVKIPTGTILSPENVKIEEVLSNSPEPADWKLPYGLVTRRSIAANTVIGPSLLVTARPEVLLKRNKTVIIRVKKVGLLVTAIGKTMQKGSAGEHIKVRNIDSQRIIVARINEDGTVEPVF
jgi:flagella basal body P-ring formation protein FlgA